MNNQLKVHIETDRLLLRDVMDEDVHGFFAMDSDAEVHTFLGKKPIETLQEAQATIANIKQQYRQHNIGRWAVVAKNTGEFIGWSGFRLITDTVNGRTNYYDLGYRFQKKYWGNGYASETAVASLAHGFSALGRTEICAIAEVAHIASNKILQKIGLHKINEFSYEGVPHNFYSLTKEQWLKTL